MKEKKPMSRKKKIIIGVVVGYFGLGFIGLLLYAIPTALEKSAKEKKAGEAKELAAKVAAMSEEERIAYYVDMVKLPAGFKKAVVTKGVEDRCTVSVFVPELLGGEDRLVKMANVYGLECASKVYANCPEIGWIRFGYDTNYMDSYGNVSRSGAYAFTLTRDSFSRLNYENFHDMITIDYNTMWSVVEDVYFNSIIQRALKNYRK